MATFVASFEEYGWVDPHEREDHEVPEEEGFHKIGDKWPVDTFINIEDADDKKLGMLLIQKQLLEEMKEKDESTLSKIAELNSNIECLKSKDTESKKVEILKNIIPSKQTINNDLSKIKKMIVKNHEKHEEKLSMLSAKKNLLRDHLRSQNVKIDDVKYEIHKKIQRNDMEFVDRINRLESIQQNLVETVKDGSLTKLLMPIDEELISIKNNHSLVVMALYCQKNILDRESKLLSGQVEDYLKEITATINTFESSEPSNSDENNPIFEDVNYLKNTIGTPIILGLAEIIAKTPHDPVHYLAHWLFAYRYNKDATELKKRELDELLIEREHIQDEIKKRQAEIDAYDAIIDLINRMVSEHVLHNILPDAEQQPVGIDVSDQFPSDILST